MNKDETLKKQHKEVDRFMRKVGPKIGEAIYKAYKEVEDEQRRNHKKDP